VLTALAVVVGLCVLVSLLVILAALLRDWLRRRR
jgi:hypothetical protein